ncbi:serine/threonine-protein kinase EDR1-like isoform X2 [Bradysia coprophila]|uniref:serine/threonine-protein kinase EDR1-like isoform X2 n=1 Tax=Bradysia coprophila TaxID=38358 RepID=UPI00187DA977|nr:serine/threonine-protein kinase EDR1-like isoform X2 [Bradysia coprophila]
MPRTYVDNAYNRSIGRVGMTVGSAVVSRSSSSQSSGASYVDNSQNRSLGRVGLPLGTAVHSRSSVGTSAQSFSLAGSPRAYVDNAYNRRLGRVGLPLGSAVHSRSSGSSLQSGATSSTVKTYVDNAYNRKLGRVGLQLGTAPESTLRNPNKNRPQLQRLLMDLDEQANNEEGMWQHLVNTRNVALNDDDLVNCDQLEEILNRRDAAKVQKSRSVKSSSLKFDGHVIDFAELEIGDKIGSGGFADVHVAMWKTDYQVAVKKLRVQRVSQTRKVEFENEARLLSTLKHPAIITLYGACIETPNLALVMEFMPKGSLHDLLLESVQLSDDQKKSLIHDSLSALQYIHERKVSHRDIKSRNILVCENLTNCKLSDFGLALKEYCETSTSVTSVATYHFVGTIKYSPPEVLKGDRLNQDDLMVADIYSMALTIVELISEQEPFDGFNQNQIRKAVLAGEMPSIDDVPVDLKGVITKCLGEAKHRPSAVAFLNEFLKVKQDLWI